MIIKASQRGGGQDLAAHLMRIDDNEHLSIHEMRGFASGNLKGAFKEVEAVSRGTKCKQYLFSVSLSPPDDGTAPQRTRSPRRSAGIGVGSRNAGTRRAPAQRPARPTSRRTRKSIARKATALALACSVVVMSHGHFRPAITRTARKS